MTVSESMVKSRSEMKSVQYIKGNHEQNEKTTCRMGEDICKRCNWLWLNFQNIQTAHITQQQKNKQLDQKMGRGPK